MGKTIRVTIPRDEGRNELVLPMTLRCKAAKFHDKRANRGGSRNHMRDIMSEIDDEVESSD